MNWRDLLVLLWGLVVIAIGFAAAMFFTGPSFGSETCPVCDVFILELDGQQVDTGGEDLSKEECGALWEEIEPQTPPFSRLYCVEVEAERQRL